LQTTHIYESLMDQERVLEACLVIYDITTLDYQPNLSLASPVSIEETHCYPQI